MSPRSAARQRIVLPFRGEATTYSFPPFKRKVGVGTGEQW
jgi:hypothetical protein